MEYAPFNFRGTKQEKFLIREVKIDHSPIFSEKQKAYLLAGALVFAGALFTHLVIEPELARAKETGIEDIHTESQLCAHLKEHPFLKVVNVSKEDLSIMCS
jgi:hypothetical protein